MNFLKNYPFYYHIKMKNGRIEFIDLTKGICMLLVVWTHTVSQFTITNVIIRETNSIITSFYMPLFFIISGMFAKSNLSLKSFLFNKVNTVFFPFLFFYVISFVTAVFVSEILHVKLNNEFSFYNIFAIFESKSFSNGALWFLSAIFFSSVFFYLISVVTKKNEVLRIIAILLLSSLGFCWHQLFSFRPPFYIDTALTALLFLYFGEQLINYLKLFSTHKYSKKITLVFSILLTIFLKDFGGAMVSNAYATNIILFYIVGLTGTLFILSLSSFFKKGCLLEHIGKYSIIVLCTHYFLITPLKLIFRLFVHNQIYLSILIFSSIILLMFPVIYLFKKYLPVFVGLKPVFQINCK